MHKIALIALLTLPLFSGFFPQTVHTSIKSVGENSATLKSSFPVNGMSGVVIHKYGSDLEGITQSVVQNAPKEVTFSKQNILHHESLPSIKTAVKAGDKVIGGYHYDNVLLLAPDAQTYNKITSKYRKTWIHPDLYAMFLSQEGDTLPSKQNLSAFAKSHQVGLVYIVASGTAKLLDPISGNIIAQQKLNGLPKEAKSPFFMRFDEIETGLFTSKKTANYYQIMDSL